MKEFLSHLRSAIASTLVFTVILCGAYPLLVFCIAQVAFHDKANGSLIVDPDGTVQSVNVRQ